MGNRSLRLSGALPLETFMNIELFLKSIAQSDFLYDEPTKHQ